MKRIVLFSFAALTAFLAAGCGPKNNGANGKQELDSPVVSVVTAQKDIVPLTSEYSSVVEAKVVNNIAPQSAVRINAIHAEVGDYVEAGKVLAEMDPVSLQKAKLQMTNDKNELDRARELYSVGGISKSDLELLELSASLSRSTYENLEENTVLVSPVTGYITARNYDAGDMYTMGQPIYVVEQIVPVKMVINVSESDFSKVKEGMPVRISLDAYPGEVFNGKLSLIYPTIDPATHTFSVEVEAKNADRRIRPGMFARVVIEFGENNSVVLPDIAVIKQTGSGERFVYKVVDNKAEYVKINVGRRMGDRYEVLSGVDEGDLVVVKGQNRLKSGIEVTINK